MCNGFGRNMIGIARSRGLDHDRSDFTSLPGTRLKHEIGPTSPLGVSVSNSGFSIDRSPSDAFEGSTQFDELREDQALELGIDRHEPITFEDRLGIAAKRRIAARRERLLTQLPLIPRSPLPSRRSVPVINTT
jgi:hypothetical protein